MTGLDIGWIMWLVLGVSAMAIVWYLVVLSLRAQDRATADPQAILEGRLARGEIDATEYEQARRRLR